MRTSVLRRMAPFAAALAVAACGSSSGTEPQQSAFALEVNWLGTAPTGATRQSFDNALARVETIITGQLTRVSLPASFTNLSDCGLPGYPDIARADITGIRVYLVVEDIDGAGGTLGSAGPCLIRPNDIPALGVMRLDAADVANLQSSGRLERVVLHEMFHILGFGTVWRDLALIDTTTNPANARFLGAQARGACVANNGGADVCAASVPVHSTDGIGSIYSHWRETTFDTELMTPFLDAGVPNPLSATSIQSLTDLGYVVNASAAESYTLPAAALRASEDEAPALLLPEPMRPRWKLDGRGGLVPFRGRR